MSFIGPKNVFLDNIFVKNKEANVNFTARSQIPVVGVTGCAPGWPGALKLPGATVKQTYKYYTPEKQCVMCVTNFWILIISIHTSRFGNRIKQIWQPLLFINGYLRMEYTLFQDFAYKIPHPAPPTGRPGRVQAGRTPEFGYRPLPH